MCEKCGFDENSKVLISSTLFLIKNSNGELEGALHRDYKDQYINQVDLKSMTNDDERLAIAIQYLADAIDFAGIIADHVPLEVLVKTSVLNSDIYILNLSEKILKMISGEEKLVDPRAN